MQTPTRVNQTDLKTHRKVWPESLTSDPATSFKKQPKKKKRKTKAFFIFFVFLTYQNWKFNNSLSLSHQKHKHFSML